MNLEYEELPLGQPLTEAYTRRSDPGLSALFGYHYTEDGDWRRRAEWLDGHAADRADAAAVAETLLAYNRRFGRSERQEERIRKLPEGAPVVVGGQQAGLWSGPLMVLHKAVTIIRTARRAEELLGRPVVPVFWIAGEDHDWDEANHAYIVSGEPKLRKLSVARPPHLRTSVSRTPVTASQWRTAVDELAAALPDGPGKPELIERLRGIAGGSGTMSEQFAGILHWLFADEGLVLLDADDPALRRLEAPMFGRMIAENDALEAAYAQAEERVRSLGYPLQAEMAEGSANLFFFLEGRSDGVTPLAAGDRVLLFKENGELFDRKGTFRLSAGELMELASSSPERFSNNVLTRPLMQDYVLPVLAAVLGPGEIAYWASTGEAFKTFGMRMPIVVPRLSFTIVDAATDKYMREFELDMAGVRRELEARRERWLDEQDELALAGRFEAVKRDFAKLYTPLLADLPSVAPGLDGLGETNLQRIEREIAFLQGKVREAHRVKHQAALRRLDRISCHLAPEGKPQERLLNFAVFWGQYGRTWLDELLRVPLDRPDGHYIIRL